MPATVVVRGGLSVEPVRDSRLVKINYDSTVPGFSVRVANAVAEGFIASGLERKFGATSYAKTYLEDQLKLTKAKLEESERKLVSFAQQEGLVSTGENGQSLATQNLTQLNAALANAQDQRIRAQARWRQASSGAMPADMIGNSNIRPLQQQRAQLQGQYQLKLQTFKPDYPDMQQLKGQIDELDRQIAAENGSVRASVRAEYNAAATQERMLIGQISSLRSQALDVDGRSIQYNILKRETDTNRQIYDSLLQRFKEVGVAGGVRANNISIIDRAQTAWRIKPDPLTNIFLGILLGLLLGVLVALLQEFLDDTLKTPLDVEQKLKLAVLGVIPKLGQKESVAVAIRDPRSTFAEAYRSVRTALQFSTDHGVPKTLLVTSSGPGEGKSTTALALARNFAQLGKRVLLIEADLRNPSLHRTLGLQGHGIGLSNLLAGGCTLAEATHDSARPVPEGHPGGPLAAQPGGTAVKQQAGVAADGGRRALRPDHHRRPAGAGPGRRPDPGQRDGRHPGRDQQRHDQDQRRPGRAEAPAGGARAHRGRLLAKYDVRTAGYSYGYGYHYQHDAYYAYGGKPKLTKG
ncbi:GNVR domain-containing protein [Thermomonas sp.]|uniref:GumC family protein n=1 Tax=Thermomonas sp. TaxID=1971895 RepID=UPI002622E23B|nr:GNVR domain-containing protein [Thermomonas sp.]MBL0229038.1 hypothetical protein [Thermomonas sp.]